jgi:2-polyprenyl-3-methyl-5-hydroxy-6-metoxy-1,4-benzoquinol methylase
MTNTQEDFWSTYYGKVVKKGDAWLDYSNDVVQAQTFALALEAAGAVGGRHCVDIGCGWGQFTRALSALGAATAVGIDIVPEVIERNAREYPQIQWRVGSLHDAALLDGVESADLIFLIEVLQYAPFAETLGRVWDRLRPGGRVVAVVPNAGCALVSRTRSRFEERYVPLGTAEIAAHLAALPQVGYYAYRGMAFAGEQRLAPYEISGWRQTGGWNEEPNRIQFVAIKQPPAVPSES